jgi:hypothetical protein
MASRYWIKLYIEILDDPKMGRITDYLWRRAIELFLLAGENRNDGLLQPVADMAWRLRVDENRLLENLLALSEAGVVHETPEGWVVTNFCKRQAVETNAERQAKYRARERTHQVTGINNHGSNERVTNNITEGVTEGVTGGVTENVLDIEIDKDKDIEKESEKEVEVEVESFKSDSYFWGKIPKTPFEASKHPAIQVFFEVTSRLGTIGQYKTIIDSERLILSRLECGRTGLIITLKPFYKEWRSRKNANGQPYDPNGIAWLTEWAVNNQIPPKPAKKGVPDHLLDDEERYKKYHAPWMDSEQEDSAAGSQEATIEASAEGSEEEKPGE